jgi:small ligand-binding sensory domain FIST
MNEPAFSVAGRWPGGWDEDGLREWAADLRRSLGSRPVTLGLLFAAPEYFDRAEVLLELLRVHAQIPLLAGCSSPGLVVGGREHEDGRGLSLALYSLPGATVHAFVVPPLDPATPGPAPVPEWPAGPLSGCLAFIEPFHTDAEGWLDAWQAKHPQVPVFGGLAAGPAVEARAQVYLDGRVIQQGGVVLGFSGVRLLGMVAQGCTPVGDEWTITRAEGNIIQRIGNRPAVAVLEETFEQLRDTLKRRSRGNFFAGLVVDEYQEEHHRGDFLVRNLLGADPDTGALAVAAIPRAGQTLQFQLRDAAAADEEVRTLLGRLRDLLGRTPVYGGCLCLCNGRGSALFGEPDHDAGLVQQILGPHAVAGFFGNGEFGPVGSRSFLHGYTASLVLFTGPPRPGTAEP